MQYEPIILLISLLGGLATGVVGSLVGVGGGFLLVPVLTMIAPAWTPAQITGFSLAVVTANAIAGTFAHWRGGRVDRRSAPWFALATIPGAVGGVIAATFVARRPFEVIFGVLLLALAVWLVVARVRRGAGNGNAERSFVDRSGAHVTWSFSMPLAITGAAVIGFASSFFGIGGGPIHVPFLVAVLGYPEHVAGATALAVLTVSASVGTLVHVAHGDYAADLAAVLLAAGGAVVGGALGARLSPHVSPRVLRTILAAALAIVGVRLIA